MVTPRDHQSKDMSILRSVMHDGAKRILFEASCGYGKSVVIQVIAISYARAGKHVLVLANRTAVVNQLRDRAAGETNISVMTVQTADARRKRGVLGEFDVIMVDEAHMGGAGAQYGRVMDASPEALVIGFTGTPTPALFKILPAHVEGHGARWLTDNGFLAPLRPFCPDRTDLRKARTRNGDFVEEDIIAEVEAKDICGDAIKSYRDHCAGRPTLLFAINKRHANAVADEFAAAGIESRVLLGGDKDVEEKLAWIKAGGLLIAVDKVSAGFDLPGLHAIISLRPTKSAQLWVQQLGRAARASDGKLYGLVFDHVGNFRRCGTLTEIRDWRNDDQVSDERQTEDGERLSVRRCEECFYVWDTGGCECPECGHDNGADLRISKKRAIEIREESIERIEAERQAANLAAMADLARKKKEEEEEKARRAEQRKHLGMGLRQRAAFLRTKGVPNPFKTAVDQMRNRLNRAIREGDGVAERFARGELRAAGIPVQRTETDDMLDLINEATQ
ncbi:DEAD/DEAH box helicase [Sulfitobacter dubius]|uniref:DEAD/DEAH box helicase n=1 Tax=Sulfitobacter dubius TaxID=218673 RepID=UPI0022B053B5|nr:DEAD/DEAH box helicase family protein [Sulfitobacter dubius]MCZ4366647.1 DEAD/DEAH box helicase family protein [Sulfitobacter dubius]